MKSSVNKYIKNFPFVLYGCETWPTLWEKCRLRVFKNRIREANILDQKAIRLGVEKGTKWGISLAIEIIISIFYVAYRYSLQTEGQGFLLDGFLLLIEEEQANHRGWK